MRKILLGTWACLGLSSLVLAAQSPAASPPRYVWADAFHILPETTSEGSGYFSLSEGLDGKIHVGSAKYGVNSFLIEFDPASGRQRIVLDTHKTCGLNAAGYAAQAKIHTRNFVGPSGVVYVGSKQGYRRDNDTSEYAGGYVMTYDPRSGQARCLGMPYPKEGVIDVVADEKAGSLYVVTCEEQHWMTGPLDGSRYRELGPMLTRYATTLIDRKGRAHAITRDFELATYDPANGKVRTREIRVGGKKWSPRNDHSIPTWDLAADGRTAYLVLLNDVNLLQFDLLDEAAVVEPRARGALINGKNPDTRCALRIGPDRKVYGVVRVDNDTGFGSGYLHHLVRFDPARSKADDLGVLAVRNPGYFPFGPGPDGKVPPHSDGFHTLPDGTLTPLHHHMAMIVARDGTLYVTVIAPFTLLRIPAPK